MFPYFCRKFITMPIFFVVLFSIYLAGNFYIFKRGAEALVAQPFGVKILLAALFWCGALSFIGSFWIQNTKLPITLAHTTHEIGTGWLVFTLYMVLCLAVFDLFRLFNFSCKYEFHISLFLTLSLLSYGYYNYQHPKTEVFNIVINKPAVHYEQPLKVVSVSDIHLGYGTDKEELKQYVEMINAQKPDLILIGGDLIDSSVVPLYEEKMMEELAELKAPLGIYMVPGNHEYISGIRKSMQFINETPIRLLRDEVVTLPGGIQIIGRDDRSNKSRLSLQELMKNIDPAKPVILLDHQPYDLPDTESAGIDLQFSGHTHRGQVWPISLVTDRLFDQSYGYRKWGNSHIYVSSGLSLWGPPFRIGTDSELVVFNILCK